ncbi:hypothetical protein GCM10009646_86070 [Streptomyces aureus]
MLKYSHVVRLAGCQLSAYRLLVRCHHPKSHGKNGALARKAQQKLLMSQKVASSSAEVRGRLADDSGDPALPDHSQTGGRAAHTA